jgi:hypothetical protein
MMTGRFLVVLVAAGLCAGGAAAQKKSDKLSDPQMLARLLPLQWMGMNLLADKEWSKQRIAQLEVAVASASYTSKDFSREGSFEIVDALRSPMHLNEFAYQRDSAAPENLLKWGGPWGEGYIVQDPAENESRARLLIRGRWYAKVSQSPKADPVALRAALEAWLAGEKIRDALK